MSDTHAPKKKLNEILNQYKQINTQLSPFINFQYALSGSLPWYKNWLYHFSIRLMELYPLLETQCSRYSNKCTPTAIFFMGKRWQNVTKIGLYIRQQTFLYLPKYCLKDLWIGIYWNMVRAALLNESKGMDERSFCFTSFNQFFS